MDTKTEKWESDEWSSGGSCAELKAKLILCCWDWTLVDPLQGPRIAVSLCSRYVEICARLCWWSRQPHELRRLLKPKSFSFLQRARLTVCTSSLRENKLPLTAVMSAANFTSLYGIFRVQQSSKACFCAFLVCFTLKKNKNNTQELSAFLTQTSVRSVVVHRYVSGCAGNWYDPRD